MESQSIVDSSTPLLKESYAYGVVGHPFPLNCLIGDWPLGFAFFYAVKVGIVQYMILKLICSLLAMILETFGVYGEGKFTGDRGVAVAFLFSMGAFKGSLAQELKTWVQDYIICIEMGVAAVVHLYVFPAVPYKRGETCVRNVAVMTDCASLGAPPDPEEVHDCERTTRMHLAVAQHDGREKRLNFPQSVCDVIFGSGEIFLMW